MENKITNIKERILQIAEFKGIAKELFFKQIGMTYGNFKGKSKETPINSNALEDIITNNPEINLLWLLTGKGSMINNVSEKTILKEYECSSNKEDVVVYESKCLIKDNQQIPLYDIEASAGIVSLFNDMQRNNVVDYLHVPGIPKCDGAIYITGDSMYPLLKSGDIVLYKKINDPINSIYFYGEMYIIGINQEDDDYIVVKYIHKSDISDQHIRLVSQNQHHDPIDILKSQVRALALIRASIRINSMK